MKFIKFIHTNMCGHIWDYDDDMEKARLHRKKEGGRT
jgi:hypothetical protein